MSIIQKFYAGIRTNYIAFINSSKKKFYDFVTKLNGIIVKAAIG